jgi:hypothetical protein
MDTAEELGQRIIRILRRTTKDKNKVVIFDTGDGRLTHQEPLC